MFTDMFWNRSDFAGSYDIALVEFRFKLSFANRIFGRLKATEVVMTDEWVRAGEVRIAHVGEPWTCNDRIFWTRISRKNVDSGEISFLLSKEKAAEFLELAHAFQTRKVQNPALHRAGVHLEEWSRILASDRYVPRHEVESWQSVAKTTASELYPYIKAFARIFPDCPSLKLARLADDPFIAAEQRNNAFVARELIRQEPWFSTFENPPTRIQREVAVRDETNALVVAGAGTGKTSTIISKLRYLVHAKLAVPEEILVLAFNKTAAAEIRERMIQHGGAGIVIETFHALGLRIVGEASGEKPPLLTELGTDESRTSVIEKLIKELSSDKAFAESYSKFLFLYSRPIVDRFDSNSESQYVSRTKAAIAQSFSGDWVRSSEELRIANWLWAHRIEFHYEKPYPQSVSPGRKRYQPDFTLIKRVVRENGEVAETEIYLEHQALNEQGKAPAWMPGYAEKVEWDRNVHRLHGTPLIESFSWWFRKGVWEAKLKAALTESGILVPEVDWQARLEAASTSASTSLSSDRGRVVSLIRRCLDLIRCTADVSESVSEMLATAINVASHRALSQRESARETLFDAIFQPVQTAYETYKKKRQGIDFEDMIYLSRQIVKQGKFQAPWKYYIVDEFQDASLSRLELVNSLRRQRSDSRLTCIGDDWQAIIRFAGGDIRVMTQFEKRVGPFWKAELGQTFRYPPIIAEISASFVTANPDQLKKSIIPASGRKDLPVRIVLTAPNESSHQSERSPTFNDVISQELSVIRENKSDASVFLLSRYGFGIPHEIEQDSIRSAFPTLKLTWSTVHSSKGREADAVILSDLDDGAMGFPCLKEDDPLIRKYLPPEDSFEHAEERRLFYVAMTRAKHQLTLIANAIAPSPFIAEILSQRNGRPGLYVISSGEISKLCPKCQSGHIVSREGRYGRFFACTKTPVCSHTEDACPRCRRGFLIPSDGVMTCSKSATEGCKFTSKICPRCKTGWLVIKTNRARGNRFWGCNRYLDDENQCKYTENP